MRQRDIQLLVVILVIAVLAAWVAWPSNPGLHFKVGKTTVDRDISVHLGLDLRGGMQVLLEVSKKKKIGNADIYRLLHDIPLEVSLYLMAKSGRTQTKKAFSIYFTQLQHARVHLTGKPTGREQLRPIFPLAPR